MRRYYSVFMAYVIGVTVLLGFAPAFAEETSNAVVAGGEHVITIPMTVWAMITGTVIPLVVGLLTKITARPGVKIVTSLVLNAVSGIVGAAVVLDGNAVISTETLVLAGLTLIQSLATYVGIWKPLNSQAHLAPTKGLG